MPFRREQCDDEVALVNEIEPVIPFRWELRDGAEVKEGVILQTRFVRKVLGRNVYPMDFDSFWDFL